MAIFGKIEDLSLPEVFKVLDAGKKSGMLTLRVFESVANTFKRYDVWFKLGKIVAVTDVVKEQYLVDTIKNSLVLEIPTIAALNKLAVSNTLTIPLGEYLRNENLLTSQHIASAFELQVIHPIQELFGARKGIYTFDDSEHLSVLELTGLQITVPEMNLLGLRSLKDWTHLANRLPDINSSLFARLHEMKSVQLDLVESQLLQFANGKKSLKQITNSTNISLIDIQKAAFCLIMAGFAEELPLTPALQQDIEFGKPKAGSLAQAKSTSSKVSSSLFGNLTVFLKNKNQTEYLSRN